MVILIDNGHGSNTAGKCSPDGRHREYRWARDFAGRLCSALKEDCLDARLLVAEEDDISIRERVRRVNTLCAREGNRRVVLLSMHNDAKGSDGRWHEARGFSARISLNASAASKRLAEMVARSMDRSGISVRKPAPGQWYWPQNLGLCRDTLCPAVLCENLFQDNREDVALLHDEEFLRRLTRAYVLAVEEYIYFNHPKA